MMSHFDETPSSSTKISAEKMAATRLAMLPAMTFKRLRTLLSTHSALEVVDAVSCWEHARERSFPNVANHIGALLVTRCSPAISKEFGFEGQLGGLWSRALQSTHVDSATLDGSSFRSAVVDETLLAAMDIRLLGTSEYPDALAGDHAAPALLFTRGDIKALQTRRVGIVGTRNATEHGRNSAAYFGRVLSQHGVAVISGLARGIDAAAHRGVLAARRESESAGRPVGVVATGLDVVYPREHHALWNEVAAHGLLLTESPPGSLPLPYRFPMRNRIIAALSEVLLVVESRLDGGSLITVREAMDRGVTVMAVPGSTATKAAQGTNMLIRDGALVAIEPDDVLMVLGLDGKRQILPFDSRCRPTAIDATVLELFDAAPMNLDEVAALASQRLSLCFADVALALGRLEAQGWLRCTAGWFELIRVR